MDAQDSQAEAVFSNHAGLTSSRIQSLGDGIFSIAMTLLVLSLSLPAGTRGVLNGIYGLGPQFVAYFLSFVVLGNAWIAHHNQFHWIRQSNRSLLWINLAFFAFVGMIPFSTSVFGQYTNNSDALLFYAANIGLCTMMLLINWVYATSRRRLVAVNLNPRLINLIEYRLIAVIAVTVLAAALSSISIQLALLMLVLTQLLALIPLALEWQLMEQAYTKISEGAQMTRAQLRRN